MPEQTFQTHTQRVPAYNALALVLTLTLIGAGVNLYQSWGDHQRLYSASLILVLSACAFGTTYFTRVFPLRAQDRAIRAEENLRHYVLTGKLLDARLHPLQIVALRFASDAELPALAEKAAASGMTPDEIKRAIRTWRPDTYRV